MADSPGSPKRPTSAISVISNDSSDNEKKVKLEDVDDDKITSNQPALPATPRAVQPPQINVLPVTYPPPVRVKVPSVNVPALNYANIAAAAATSGYAIPTASTSNIPASVAAQGYRMLPPPPLMLNTNAWLEDIMTNGLFFLDQLRHNTALGIDDEMRQLLLDPLLHEEKPLMVCDPLNIPQELYDYFHILTFHVNKIIGTPCIWLDLCKSSKSYSLFAANVW